MIEAVIVSTARTPIGKAFRGALNNTEGPTMAGHVIGEAVRRAKVEPREVEDVVMGCAMQQGTTAMNVARKGAIRAGLPVTVAGTTIDRQCASGLQAIAVAARSMMLDAGGRNNYGLDYAILRLHQVIRRSPRDPRGTGVYRRARRSKHILGLRLKTPA